MNKNIIFEQTLRTTAEMRIHQRGVKNGKERWNKIQNAK